jgi:hypothetical protein
MKVLVDIKDEKAAFVLELLNSFSFVKTKAVKSEKNSVKSGIEEAVEELNQILKGKKKGRPAENLFDEL